MKQPQGMELGYYLRRLMAFAMALGSVVAAPSRSWLPARARGSRSWSPIGPRGGALHSPEIAATRGPEAGPAAAIDEDLYSRQLYVLGREAQKTMEVALGLRKIASTAFHSCWEARVRCCAWVGRRALRVCVTTPEIVLCCVPSGAKQAGAVLVVGLTGPGVEIAKNLALAGVGVTKLCASSC
jgi:hypothetical protein